MTSTLIIAGSPSSTSRSHRLALMLGDRLRELSIETSLLDLRTLPAEDLLHARSDAPAIVAAVAQLAAASGVVIVTPVYKAAYSGLLKTFLDLLPQFGLRDKVVLPFAMGGTIAHVLSIDYALRPVLNSLDPLHVVNGLFVLDKQLIIHPDGKAELSEDLIPKLDLALDGFITGLHRAAHQVTR